MNRDEIAAFLGVLVSFGGLISAAASAYVALRMTKDRGQGETIEEKVRRLTSSLTEATSLINNIELEIKARSALATQLQEDIDQYNKLVELKKPEVEAIAQLLRGELKKEGRAAFWKGFIINFIFFILGAAASLVTTMLVK